MKLFKYCIVFVLFVSGIINSAQIISAEDGIEQAIGNYVATGTVVDLQFLQDIVRKRIDEIQNPVEFLSTVMIGADIMTPQTGPSYVEIVDAHYDIYPAASRYLSSLELLINYLFDKNTNIIFDLIAILSAQIQLETLSTAQFLSENGIKVSRLKFAGDNNSPANRYIHALAMYDTQRVISLGGIAHAALGLTSAHWLAIVASRGDFVGIQKLFSMLAQADIDVIPLERKKMIVEKAIRAGNLEVVNELIARFGLAKNKILAHAIMNNFPKDKEQFIRKAFAQVDFTSELQSVEPFKDVTFENAFALAKKITLNK